MPAKRPKMRRTPTKRRKGSPRKRLPKGYR